MRGVLGIDPGNRGALALYGPSHLVIEDMPLLAEKMPGRNGGHRSVPDLPRLWELVRDWAPFVELAVLEKASSWAGELSERREAAPAAFRYGRLNGSLEMAIIAAGIPLHLVTPDRWKAAMGVAGKKANSTTRFKHFFPGQKPGRGDRAEAALIALYGVYHLL